LGGQAEEEKTSDIFLSIRDVLEEIGLGIAAAGREFSLDSSLPIQSSGGRKPRRNGADRGSKMHMIVFALRSDLPAV
jgi:hypothetical protein